MSKKLKKIDELSKTTIDDIGLIADGNQITGKPILSSDGKTVIPVSKITVGYLNGGSEFGEVKIFSKDKSKPYAAAGGAVVNLSPCGFLVVGKDTNEFIKIPDDLMDRAFEKTTQFIEKALNEKN